MLFVWDCDVSFSLPEENNTYPFVLPRNEDNTLVRTGIENAFPQSLFDNFIKTITRPNGEVIRQFDEASKKDFAVLLSHATSLRISVTSRG